MAPKSTKAILTNQDEQHLKALRPGDIVDLQISTPTASKRVKTGFIGLDIPHCLIFQIPSQSKWGYLRDVLVPEAELVIRYVLEGEEGKVIAFKANVIRILAPPTPMLLTTVPPGVQTLPLRSEKRCAPGIYVQITRTLEKGNSVSTDGLIVDVSLNGCRMVMELDPDFPQLDVDDEIIITINLAHKATEITALIKNTRSELKRLSYGVQFTSEENVIEKLIQQYVLQY
jgi:hypothetical protein